MILFLDRKRCCDREKVDGDDVEDLIQKGTTRILAVGNMISWYHAVLYARPCSLGVISPLPKHRVKLWLERGSHLHESLRNLGWACNWESYLLEFSVFTPGGTTPVPSTALLTTLKLLVRDNPRLKSQSSMPLITISFVWELKVEYTSDRCKERFRTEIYPPEPSFLFDGKRDESVIIFVIRHTAHDEECQNESAWWAIPWTNF